MMKRLLPSLMLVFLLASCNLTSKNSVSRSAEQYLPADVFLMTALDTSHSGQRMTLNSLMKKFKTPEGKTLSLQFIDEWLMTMAEEEAAEFDYETEIRPIFGDSNRYVFAMRPALNHPDEAHVFLSFQIRDHRTFSRIMKQFVADGDLVREKRSDAEVYINEEEMFYMADLGDLAVITNDMSALEEAMLGRTERLNRSRIYVDVMKQLPVHTLGRVYLNYEALAAFMEPELVAEAELTGIDPEQILSSMRALTGIGATLVAKPHGLDIDGYIKGHPEKLDELGMRFDQVGMFTPSLLSRVPRDVLLYTEAWNMKAALEMTLNQLSATLPMTEVGSVDDGIAMFEEMTGLDLEDDVLSWMDKAASFAIAGGEFLPKISVLVDASSRPSAAEKVFSTLAETLKPLLSDTLELEYMEDSSDGMFYGATYQPAANLSELGFPEIDASFYFGKDSKDMAAMGLGDVKENQAHDLTKNPDFMNVYKEMEGPFSSFFYLDFHGTLSYLDSVLVKLGEAEDPEWSEIRNILSPLKTLHISSKNQAHESRMKGTLVIE